MRRLAALFLLGALLAPASLAQVEIPGGPSPSLSVAVEDPGRSIAPGKTDALVILINYNVPLGGHPAPGSDPTSTTNDTRPTRISLEVKTMPSWIDNVSFEPPIVEIHMPAGAAAGSQSARAVAIIHAKSDAPALHREEFIVTARAEPNGNIPGKTSESPPINLRATFVAKVNVTAPESSIVPGGRWHDMPFTITNLGNAETKVKLNVTARPQDSQVEYPLSVTLPLGGSQEVVVRLRVPWTYGERGIVELEATPLTDQDEGKPTKRAIEVHGQSAVPTVQLPLMLAGLVALALLRRQ